MSTSVICEPERKCHHGTVKILKNKGVDVSSQTVIYLPLITKQLSGAPAPLSITRSFFKTGTINTILQSHLTDGYKTMDQQVILCFRRATLSQTFIIQVVCVCVCVCEEPCTVVRVE